MMRRCMTSPSSGEGEPRCSRQPQQKGLVAVLQEGGEKLASLGSRRLFPHMRKYTWSALENVEVTDGCTVRRLCCCCWLLLPLLLLFAVDVVAVGEGEVLSAVVA